MSSSYGDGTFSDNSMTGDASASPPPPPSSSDFSSSSSSSSTSSSPPPPPPSSDGSSSSYSPPSDGSSSSPPPPSPSSGGDSSSESYNQSKSEGNYSNGDNGKSSKSDSSGGDSPPVDGSSGGSSMKELPKSSQENQKAIIAGAAASAALLLIIVILCCVCCCRKRKRRHKYYHENPHSHASPSPLINLHCNDYYSSGFDGNVKMTPPPPGSGGGMSSDHSWMPPAAAAMMSSGGEMSSGYSGGGMGIGGYNQGSFTYNDLAAATEGFCEANLLGQGGFGYVHKGVLPNGKEVAVKSLKSNSGQGEREFQAEVEIISRVHHRHLVSLVGYCTAGAQRMLVYEFVDNGTLEFHLYGAGRPTMEWATRLKIALGAAKGFAYLHEDCNPRIIHRDIKTANILIDRQFEAKVADFGLAKLSSDTNTHVSTRIMGTFGYLAPEYASTGKLTEKSDVYSFGVVLLELITGRRPIDLTRDDDDDTLVDWARPILMSVQEGGSFEELVDPRLGNNYNPPEMLRMVHCAAAAIRQSARRRPKMSKLVRVLEGDVSLEDLNEGIKATPSSATLASSGSDYDGSRMRSSGNVPSSQEFSSDEYVHSAAASTSPAPNLPRPPAL
ncbi:putative proline-rich receptor-like protein kinase PERK6 [Andrographis paniculata]|uniref:putative proline-rich receptor-like protein kinase PERK6 n=1 Tax=Andrographis paniculata TaxID=175694 RepID=UPI0021E7CD9C|nr:putative proline-rich receptor-like protein kinase PERK6 [Andrographis paniculata]